MKPIKQIGENRKIPNVEATLLDENNDYERKFFILKTMLISQNVLTEDQINNLIESYEIMEKMNK